MKKIMITFLLTAFCCTAFAIESPQQDTTKRRQDTTKRQPMKSKIPKKKYPGKDSTQKDTIKRKPGDTTRRIPPVM
jgi:hypothetical protein